jgi:uncharacterized membrane protein
VSSSAAGLVLAVFVACAVEAVEAVTVVLAIGITRGWRPALAGAGAALGALAVVVAALGPALSVVPLEVLRLVVGGLLLVFGLQWLRKAILRASGHKALRDETAAFAADAQAARSAGDPPGSGLDPYGFTVAFKGVLLEGLEVAFIVVTLGSSARRIGLAALGALAAVLVVLAAALAARAPLARVPENAMKLAVGVLLTAFGIFWGVEGTGATWPGADAALPAVVAFVALAAWGLIAILRQAGRAVREAA